MRKLPHFVREKQTHDLLDETIFIIFAELAWFHKTLEECKSAQDKFIYLRLVTRQRRKNYINK